MIIYNRRKIFKKGLKFKIDDFEIKFGNIKKTAKYIIKLNMVIQNRN